MKNAIYEENFRAKIVMLHIEEKRTIASLSEEFGVSKSTISRWIVSYNNSVKKENYRSRTDY